MLGRAGDRASSAPGVPVSQLDHALQTAALLARRPPRRRRTGRGRAGARHRPPAAGRERRDARRGRRRRRPRRRWGSGWRGSWACTWRPSGISWRPRTLRRRAHGRQRGVVRSPGRRHVRCRGGGLPGSCRGRTTRSRCAGPTTAARSKGCRFADLDRLGTPFSVGCDRPSRATAALSTVGPPGRGLGTASCGGVQR